MTDVTDVAPAPRLDQHLDRAVQDADAAALAAGVTVREVHDLAGLADVVDLLGGIWGRGENPPVTLELLRAFGKAGNCVTGAFDVTGSADGGVEGRLVGACVGFFHAPADGALHSHIAGVAPAVTGRHIGYAVKLHQRAWAMLRGVDRIAWTFDPLVSRNAYFNLAKLGGRPTQYLSDFYGPMRDSINGADATDRLLVQWDLRAPVPGPGPVEVGPEPVVDGVTVGADGGPVTGSLDGATVRVAVPRDVSALRSDEPALAARWRVAVREALTTLLDDGGRVVGFDRSGHYLVRRSA